MRHVAPLRRLVIAGEASFVVFTIYGLAFSLMSSASTVIRRRDTIILILAATIIWGIFVEEQVALGMIRYLFFAVLIVVGVLVSRRGSAGSSGAKRILLGGIVPAVLCGVGGFIYLGLVDWLARSGADTGRAMLGGLSWGLSLGLAVGLGVSIGNEVVECLVRKAR